MNTRVPQLTPSQKAAHELNELLLGLPPVMKTRDVIRLAVKASAIGYQRGRAESQAVAALSDIGVPQSLQS